MNVIEIIRQERKLDADYLEKRPQVLKLLGKELYANVAHFIIELLQNAEDVGATEVAFNLCPNELIFEHNGRPFEEADIWSITAIAESAKEEDENAIGRFGIGFKSVFSYTETPHIWSSTYSFKISKMVLPWELSKDLTLGNRTRFKFPFNSRKKPRRQAFSEIQNELEKISDNTLLFLPCVKKIQWQIANGRKGCLIRNLHSEQHIEICRHINGDPKKSSHFLRFTELADGFKNQHIAIAFELAQLSGNTLSNMHSSIAQQFRITPAEGGCIAVYFEIQKSNLRFHLHAPFDPTLARDRIKDTFLNEQLLQQLAKLVTRSLCTIRELGLLDRDFLAVLPNSQEDILAQCEPIRKDVIDAMKEQPLTPKHVGGHAPASQLLQGEAGLKNLLNSDDFHFLIGEDGGTRDWAIAAERGSGADKFLQDLDIEQWNSGQFGQILRQHLNKRWGLDESFIDWMRRKPDEWHYRLYDFLQRQSKDELYWFEDVCIVRCSDGEYRVGGECYFPTSEVRDDPVHPRVSENTFINSGNRNKREKSAAREFLEGIGVREVGELEQIEAILEQQYADPSHIPCWKNYESDLKRFIKLAEENKNRNEIFRDYFIFQCIDQSWSRPEGVYLDAPYQSTGLEAYYSPLGAKSKRAALSSSYENLDMRDRFIEFARACGVADRLKIEEIDCDNNLNKEYLFNAPGVHFTQTGINRDFFIPDLEELLESPTLRLARLIWNTLCDQSDRRNIWQACFRWNGSNELRRAKSQLVHQLSAGKWIPQKSSALSQVDAPFTFVRPALALEELLPLPEEGFPFNPGWSWLEEIHFGKETEGQHIGISEVVERLGLSGKDQLERAVKLVKQIDRLPLRVQQEIQQLLAEQENPVALPQHKSRDQEQRSQQIRKKARQAPKYTREKRSRMILLDHSKVKEETRHYLRHQYTNSDQVTICQICEKSLPFKLSDGHYFFVAVPFLPNLERNHYQNYLALCPLHAAMFLYANDSEKDLQDKFLALDDDDSRLEIILADESTTIYFVNSHICDLKDIIDVEDGK